MMKFIGVVTVLILPLLVLAALVYNLGEWDECL